MNLLDVYNEMTKEAEVAQTVETEKVAETQEVDARMEYLEKYAELADALLTEDFGDNYTEEDVVKLAEEMIRHDIEQEQAMEKVAEAYQIGVIIAKGLKAELAQN